MSGFNLILSLLLKFKTLDSGSDFPSKLLFLRCTDIDIRMQNYFLSFPGMSAIFNVSVLEIKTRILVLILGS